jgi:acetoacetyl-CoA synthetase
MRNRKSCWTGWTRFDERLLRIARFGVSSQPDAPVREGQLLWSPGPAAIAGSYLQRYLEWLSRERDVRLDDYHALWRWSVAEPERFWASIWDHFEVRSSTPYARVIDRMEMPGAKWFEGSHVNYAEHLLRYEERAAPDEIAFLHASEVAPLAAMTWRELGRQVRILATQLRALGVVLGDRVVSYMPNVPETAIAMIATTAIGAVWSSAAPEFGVRTVIDRFVQIEPKVLFAADGYRFAGKDFQRRQEVAEIVAALPTLTQVVWLPFLDEKAAPSRPRGTSSPGYLNWRELLDRENVARESFEFTRVECTHPLWILFSSGTTGLPKAIVHGHAGMLVEHLKLTHLHMDLGPASRLFFYTTSGWMMWNVVIGALLAGATSVLYDGSPVHPDVGFLWDLASRTRTTHFGASPTFVQLMQKAGLRPAERCDLEAMRMLTVSGSPCTPETFAWVYRAVKPDIWVASQSGGTELCSGFVGAVASLPVHAGEIQARMLGMDVHAWSDDGRELVDEVGELVVTRPFPSMPLYFWNDSDGARYRESYFDRFPGAWRHGDFVKINSRGGCYVYGRSDSTLNRHGVRIGTAEIYRAVEQVEGVLDSLVVCCEDPAGFFFMPLFVKLQPGVVLDDELRKRINARLREDCSPRHVPDRIDAVDAIPYTLTGKKMEVPVRRILMGVAPQRAASSDAMANPQALDFFADYARVPS